MSDSISVRLRPKREFASQTRIWRTTGINSDVAQECTGTAREVIHGVLDAVLVEEHANYPKGPCALLLQKDGSGAPIHVVWGIPKGHDRPAVLVTVYRPDPVRWDLSFTRRRSQ